MFELPKEQQCKLMSNAEYQKVVPVLMSLATASLAVPVILAKEFTGTAILFPESQQSPSGFHSHDRLLSAARFITDQRNS